MQVDSHLIYDLRAFARDYEGSPLASRITTAANELDRLHEMERRSEWKPIETAPRGEEVLGWYPKHPLDDEGNPTDVTDGGACAIVMRHHGGGWEEPSWLDASGDYFGDDFCWAAVPTHWMPLPNGPKQDVKP